MGQLTTVPKTGLGVRANETGNGQTTLLQRGRLQTDKRTGNTRVDQYVSVFVCLSLCAKGGYRWRGAEATFPLNFGHKCVISQLVA